ncbi:MAG TPA: DUF397 domain-containing protein [Trebonia sp.]|nr:DUF397 domain-containing protein [Trebonia sp.]
MTSEFAAWRKSSYSTGNSGCMEVAAASRAVGVRDTRQYGQGPVVEFSVTAWMTFIATTREGACSTF